MINIIEKHNCCGCNACYNICPQKCIDMQTDNEGFWYPIVNIEECNNCGLCETVCPILHEDRMDNNPVAYACVNKDEIIRMQSSSGGVFTAIAESVVSNKGIVFGASFDHEFKVVHNWVDDLEELRKLRGSKYLQSRIGDTYKEAKEFLKQGREVLFTGTPCQIGGLKSYLGKSYDNLICVDIVCHGVPSPEVWKKYVDYRQEKAGSAAQRISFRRKDEGWKRYSVSFLFENNTGYRETKDKDLYMRAFLKKICLRPSCHACEFKTIHRQSDITLADFWGIERMLPDMDDDKGTSLIFINSIAGQSMMDQIVDKMILQQVDINEAVQYNSAAIKSVVANPNRDNFLAELNKLPFDVLVKKYCADKLSVRVKRKVKSVVSTALKKLGLLGFAKRILGRGQ